MTRSRKNWLTYQDASAWAQAEGIVIRSQWQARCKQGFPPHIPASPQHVYVEEFLIPSHPWDTYKDEFKQGGLRRFLGTEAKAAATTGTSKKSS